MGLPDRYDDYNKQPVVKSLAPKLFGLYQICTDHFSTVTVLWALTYRSGIL
jgi:hypothetical protein